VIFDEVEGRPVTEADVERCLAWMSANAAVLAQAIADRQHTEQFIKVVEAEQRTLHADQAAHVQERNARASRAYEAALEAYRDASKSEQRYRYLWQLAETVIDVWRTRCANERKIG